MLWMSCPETVGKVDTSSVAGANSSEAEPLKIDSSVSESGKPCCCWHDGTVIPSQPVEEK